MTPPIVEKLELAIETICACIRELPGDYRFDIRKDGTIHLWEWTDHGRTGCNVIPVTDIQSFIEYLNEHAIPAK